MIGVFGDRRLGDLGMFIKFKIYGAQLHIYFFSTLLHYAKQNVQ